MAKIHNLEPEPEPELELRFAEPAGLDCDPTVVTPLKFLIDILAPVNEMEKGDPPSLPGSRQLNLKKSFKLGIRSLLTTCSKEEIIKAFEGFSNTEQEALHQLFIQVITSLHENVEEEFELLCMETQAGAILDTVEQLVEEQSLDSLFSDKTAVGDVCRDLASLKNNEIKLLMNMLQKEEESKRIARERVEQLRKEVQGFPGAVDLLRRSRAGILDYGESKQLTP